MTINITSFAENLTYQADTSPSQIFNDLTELAEIKLWAEQKAAYFGTLAGWSLNAIVLTIMFGIIFGKATQSGILVWSSTFVLVMLLIFLIKFCSSKQSYYRKLKLRSDRCELPKKLLSMLNRDRAPNSNVKIDIIFTPDGEMGRKIQTLPHPYKGGWKVDFFEDKWLTLQGKFIDNTSFLLTSTELNRRAYGYNARGKSKTKNKPKGTEISLTLTFSTKLYGDVNIIQQEAQKVVKLPEGVQLKSMKVTEKKMDLTVQIPPNPNQEQMYKIITMMFLSLYQVLNFAKLLSRKRQSSSLN